MSQVKENTAPSGVTFGFVEDWESDTYQVTLTSGSYHGIWLKHVVPALATVGASPAVASLRFKLAQ